MSQGRMQGLRRSRFAPLLVLPILALLAWLRCMHEAGIPKSEDGPNTIARPRTASLHGREDEPGPVFRQALASISGTITEPGGRPLGGATVCAGLGHRDAPGTLVREPRCTTSLANGHYRLADLPPFAATVSASAAHHLPVTWEDTRRDPAIHLRPGEERKGVDLELEPGGVPVRGLVRDIAGGVVEGALVIVTSEHARGSRRVRPIAYAWTDAEGRFVLWSDEGAVSVAASAEGYSRSEREGMAPGFTFELFLVPESVLVGRVVLADTRAPVAGALVRVRPPNSNAITDEDGRFRIERLNPGSYHPTAETDTGFGGAETAVHVGLAQVSEPFEIAIHPAASVSGVILGDGSPCTNGIVDLTDRARASNRWGRSGAEGLVTIRGVPPGTYHVIANCDGFVRRSDFELLVVERTAIGDQRWELTRGVSLTGTIVDAHGQPIAQADVTASLVLAGRTGLQQTEHDRSDTLGQFTLAGLVPGRYHVYPKARDYLEPEEPIALELGEHGTAPQRIVLEQGGAIEGDVVDVNGQPVAGAEVRTTGNRPATTQSRDDGTFRISNAVPGRGRVMVLHGNDVLRSPGANDDAVGGEPVTVVAGEVTTVHLVVESRAGRISGRVLDAAGEPISDAFISARRESDSAAANADSTAASTTWVAWGDREPVLTDATGGFQIEQLVTGRYTLRAYRKGGGDAVVRHVEVGTTGVVLRLTDTGSITGKVTLAGGGVPLEFTVELRDRGRGYTQWHTFHQTEGAFVMTEVPAGELEVSVTSSDGDGSTTTTLESGQARSDVVVALIPKIDVRGRLVDLETGAPVGGLAVLIEPRKGRSTPVLGSTDGDPRVSDASGRFFVERVAAGPVRVRIASRWFSNHAYAETAFELDLPTDGSAVDLGDVTLLRRRRSQAESRGDLGFKLADAPPSADRSALPLTVGFVRPKGPAAAAGLLVGDVIASVDGHDVTGSHRHRFRALIDVAPGTRLALGLHGGRTIELVTGTPP